MTHVLIVEPDMAVGMTFFRAFIVAGYDAGQVDSISSAIAALKQSKSNVVVFNSSLQGDQIRSLLQTIRSLSETQPLPVIAFARSGAAGVVQLPRLQGVTESVTLGTREAEDLLQAVERVLNVPGQPPTGPAPVQSSDSEHQESTPPAPNTSDTKDTVESDDGRVTEVGKSPDLQQAKSISQRLLSDRSRQLRHVLLTELNQCFQFFTENESSVKSEFVMSLSATLSALLSQLCQKPITASSSTCRTILQAVNSLDAVLEHPSPTPPPADPVFKTLAVDDESEILSIIQDAMKTARLRSDGADTASKALQLAEQQRYDLFILDIMMPDIDGFELCKKLRRSLGYEETPVIFVTGADRFDSRIRSASSGGTDFIGKPFLPKELAVKALVHLVPRWMQLRD